MHVPFPTAQAADKDLAQSQQKRLQDLCAQDEDFARQLEVSAHVYLCLSVFVYISQLFLYSFTIIL